MILEIDHVQLAMPEGNEDVARGFYSRVLALREVPKPSNLAKRGGCWFESGSVKVHLGVTKEFTPATKAHPAFIVSDLDVLRERCLQACVACKEDEQLESYQRFFVNDPFGNRIELMQRLD